MSKSTKIFLLVIICVFIVTAAIVGIIKLWPNAYDTSKFHKITTEDAVNIFTSSDTHVIFIGRKTCGACQLIIPSLKKAQKKADLTIDYLDIDSIEWDSLEWLTFVELLDLETTEKIDIDGTEEMVTDTYGNFLNTYGFTPTLLIIKEGKLIDGHIGGATENDIIEWMVDQTK